MHGIVPRTVKLTAFVAIKFACPPRALLSMNMPTQRGVSPVVVRVAAASTMALHASAVSVAADFQRAAKRVVKLNVQCDLGCKMGGVFMQVRSAISLAGPHTPQLFIF